MASDILDAVTSVDDLVRSDCGTLSSALAMRDGGGTVGAVAVERRLMAKCAPAPKGELDPTVIYLTDYYSPDPKI
jgi:hypothetical protein